VLLGGCQTSKVLFLPRCPSPSLEAVLDIEDIVMTDGYEDLVIWISEMDRYCDAVDSVLVDG
jgi:hypothetical protein